MLKNLKKRNEGFTIIEVLIVLAIAGLILLVVFLAVPALQRNSRNTQRKQDVGALLSAVTEWSNNNNGKLPSATGTDRADAVANAKLGYYDAATAGVISWGTSSSSNPDDTEKIVIVTGAKCGTGGAAAAAGTRQVAALYTVESGNGKTKVCQES